MPSLAHALAAALALSVTFAHAVPTGYLNDTGQTSCYDASDAAVACSASGVGSDAGVNPRQDARFGRDAKTGLAKTGAGVAGFDFTKVCLSGDLPGQNTCTADPLTTDGDPWACTKDNHTNLIWSIETFSGKTWAQATDTTGGSLADGYNTASRCGFNSGWRAPTRRELLSIVHHGASSPAIDAAYFPNTVSSWYWSSDPYAPDSAGAWYVYFGNGYTSADVKAGSNRVRLVRSGQ